jgi:protein O-GlcNAc transferase
LPSVTFIMQQAWARFQQNRLPEAEQLYEQCCASAEGGAQAWFMLGATRHMRRNLEAALAAFSSAIELDPRQAPAYSARATVLAELGKHGEALASYRQALALSPGDPQLLANIGLVLETVGEADEALRHYDDALAIDPGFQAALLNRGAALMQAKRWDEALDNNLRLVSRYPDLADGHFNCAQVLLAMDRFDEALAAYDRTTRLAPRHLKAHIGQGLAYSSQARFTEAGQAFAVAKSIDAKSFDAFFADYQIGAGSRAPQDPRVIYLLKSAERIALCDWTDRAAFVARFESMVKTHLGTSQELNDRSLAYHALSFEISPETRLALAKSIAAQIERNVAGAPALPPAPPRKEARLRVGYISPDFRFHPVGRLTRQLYALHDRGRFEVYGYALRPGDGADIRRDIEQGCDVFRDLEQMSDAEAAATIRADGIDILVDLAGYTTHSRSEIMAMRPAPVQFCYNGFPGSMGADFIDYFVTDRVCSPPGQQSQFTEELVYLPDSCMIYDNRQKISARPVSRAEFSLPEQGFVYCCFNNGYKIEPVMFDVWMRVLKRTPGSVLWLLSSNESMIHNLRREAVQRGVSADRLVFAAVLPVEEHLTRYRLADLFLDTLYFNAVTTAADALWAGVPVLTYPGSTFISRWAASMLKVIGLDDMVAESLAAYEERACDLAKHPEALAAIKQRLDSNRLTQPLFDTERYVRQLETVYQTIARKLRPDT